MHTVFDIYYRIYSIPTHDKNQRLLLQFIVFLTMDAKGLPKHVELLKPNKGQKKLHLVGIYVISDMNMFLCKYKYEYKELLWTELFDGNCICKSSV